MRTVTFDIETANWFGDTGVKEYADLRIAIVCVHDSQTGEYSSYLADELSKLWNVLETADILVGFNSDHFDIPLLNNYYPGDLTSIKSIDLLKEVHSSLGRRIKLDMIAEGTLGQKKSGHGGQSLIWWRNGEVEKVRKYCLKDVEITRALYDYALEHGSLKFKELGKVREIKIDTSQWLLPASRPMTFSMGF